MFIDLLPTIDPTTQNTTTESVSTQIETTTNIEYDDALLDPTSQEYQVAAANIKNIFQTTLQLMASALDISFEEMTVKFMELLGSGRKRRKRRSTGTAAIITAVFNVPVSELTDLTELKDNIVSSTTSAANEAIANSDGSFINTDAVASVSTTPKEEVTCDGIYDGDANSGCFTLNDDGECIISNPSCQSLTCTNTHMTGSFRANLISKDDQHSNARDGPLFVNGLDCGLDFIWYSDDTGDIKFEIELGSCGMLAESVDGNIKLGCLSEKLENLIFF